MMTEQIHAPTIGELPTTRQLNKATLVAAGVAAVLLATTVLPAEYGIDPTGFGGVLGLTEIGKAKRAAAEPAEVVEDTGDIVMDAPTQTGTTAVPAGAQTQEVRFTLAPDEGTEVKATMTAGKEFTYRWATNGAPVNFELHGELPNAASNEYTTYEKGTSAGADGTFRAPFDGTHGWYWRNRGRAPVTITVSATGDYQKFAQLK